MFLSVWQNGCSCWPLLAEEVWSFKGVICYKREGIQKGHRNMFILSGDVGWVWATMTTMLEFPMLPGSVRPWPYNVFGFFGVFFGRLHTICSLLPILALKRKGQFVGLVCNEGKRCRLYNSIRGVKQMQLWPFPMLHWCLLKVDESDLFPTAWRCCTMSVEKYHNGLAPANFFMPTL